MLAGVGLSEKAMKKAEKKLNGLKTYNFKNVESKRIDTVRPGDRFESSFTWLVNAHWSNKYGLYNIIGNVAEMTEVEGVAKGGSWIHNENEYSIEKDYIYKEPTNWLGFRCVCVKIKSITN